MKQLLDRIPSYLKNFYVIVGSVFIVWIVFFDSDNILSQISKYYQYEDKVEEKEFYTDKIEEIKTDIQSIRENEETLERYAREKYHMKEPEEEVFIIVDKK